MEYNNIKEELKYLNENYNFENVLSIPLILNEIIQFLNKDNIKLLSLCNKKYIYYIVIKLKNYYYIKKRSHQIF